MYLEAPHRDYLKGRWVRLGVLAAVVVLGAAVGYAIVSTPQGAELSQLIRDSWAQRSASEQAPIQAAPVPVKTTRAVEGTVTKSLFYSGDVAAVTQVDIQPRSAGILEKLNVDVGSKVKAGDVIAELDSSALRAELNRARANLAAAQAAYSNVQSGPRSEAVARAAAALDAALARRDVVTKGATPAELQASQSALDTAKANLQAATARLETVRQGADQTAWGIALAAVDEARARLKAAEVRLADVKAGPRESDLLHAQQAVNTTQAALVVAKERLYLAQMGGPTAPAGITVSQAEMGVFAAQSAYDAAVSSLNQVKSRPSPLELQTAQSEYDSAKAGFDSAVAHVDQMKRGASPEEIQQAEAAVASAQASVASAEAGLNQLREGPRPESVRVADNDVKQAQQAYNLASNPYTQSDFDAARAGVLQAQAAVELAESNLAKAQVISPIDGVVTAKLLLPGQPANLGSPIVSILSSGVEMVVGVDEGQIGQVAEGQEAEITVAGYPGAVFPAKVSFISPSANPADRTFQVRLVPESNDGRLRAGMQAQVRILAQEKTGAVVVPKAAVVTRGDKRIVFVAGEDTVQARQVKFGLPGASGTIEVQGAVKAGEEVVVSGQDDLRDGDKIRRQ